MAAPCRRQIPSVPARTGAARGFGPTSLRRATTLMAKLSTAGNLTAVKRRLLLRGTPAGAVPVSTVKPVHHRQHRRPHLGDHPDCLAQGTALTHLPSPSPPSPWTARSPAVLTHPHIDRNRHDHVRHRSPASPDSDLDPSYRYEGLGGRSASHGRPLLGRRASVGPPLLRPDSPPPSPHPLSDGGTDLAVRPRDDRRTTRAGHPALGGRQEGTVAQRANQPTHRPGQQAAL